MILPAAHLPGHDLVTDVLHLREGQPDEDGMRCRDAGIKFGHQEQVDRERVHRLLPALLDALLRLQLHVLKVELQQRKEESEAGCCREISGR